MDYGEFDITDISGYEEILDSFNSDDFHDVDENEYWLQHSQENESFNVFSWNILVQVLPNVAIPLALCLTWRICHALYVRLTPSDQLTSFVSLLLEATIHLLSMAFGLLLLKYFFGDVYIKPCTFVFTIGLLLTASKSVFTPSSTLTHGGVTKPSGWSKHVTGVTLACLVFQMHGEFYMVPEEWHMIRGSVMILIMKAISVSARPSETLMTRTMKSSDRNCLLVWTMNYIAWCGYALSPGSVIFGPWFSFDHYLQLIHSPNPHRFSVFQDLIRTCISVAIAMVCLIYSTYITSISNATYWTSLKWINAFLQSQSFRFSHYFVSFFSQSLHQTIGFASGVGDGKQQKDLVVAIVVNPVAIELPRSLVDVVIQWNFPMHIWLKQYIYRPTRQFGQLPALLLTYAFSSLLHGLNFQLAAVLFSIGVYAYIEFILRDRLSLRWNACVGARACKPTCKHANKSNWWVRVVNLGFSALAIFHLAYLAVMFDTSDQQDTGYDMTHVLDKWSNLHFLSHLVAIATYLIYLWIR